MNGFDVALVVLFGVMGIVGVMKGFVRILAGLGALVAAFVLASRFHQDLAARGAWTGWSREALRLVTYLVIFFAVMLAGGLAAWLLRKLMKAAMLSWLDRLAGGALGVAVAALAAALLILPMVAYAPGGDVLLDRSKLAPYVAAVADVANLLAPRELAERYRKRIDTLRRRWRGEGDREAILVRMKGEAPS